MTNSIDSTLETISELLRQHRLIAPVWGVPDVLHVRPDLSEDQCWQVLQECHNSHDASFGITWDSVEYAAENMFPRPFVECDW